MIRLAIILILSSGIGGFLSGAYVTYKHYNVLRIQAENAALKADMKRFREVLALNEKLDDENTKIEEANKDIEEAIKKEIENAKIAAKDKQGKPVDVDPNSVVCVDPGFLRGLGRLR